MGQLSLFAVVAAFLISGVVIYNTNASANRSEERVWEHQYHVVARDAASTGMASAMRTLTTSFETNTPWNAAVATSLAATDVAFGGGTYTIAATASTPGPTACPLLDASEYAKALTNPDGGTFIPQGSVIVVSTTGTYQGDVGGGDSQQSHQIRACYIKADYGSFAPPAFNYGFISQNNFTFNGGPTIQALIDGQGHVHSNGDMTLRSQVQIDGHATYTGSGSIHRNTQVASAGSGPSVPLVPFVPQDFRDANGIPGACSANPNACRYDGAGFTGGTTLIAPPTTDAGNRADNPFIWYINGNLNLSGNVHVRVPQYTTIVVSGNFSISGGAAITVTGALPPNNPTPAQSRAWVQSQLFDGVHSPLAWYVGGTADMGGTPGVVGNFYVNGNVTLNGGGGGNNTVGSFASAQGNIVANGGGGGNNFWFLEVAETNVIPGVALPGKQIVRLALAEWTDPVLDN